MGRSTAIANTPGTMSSWRPPIYPAALLMKPSTAEDCLEALHALGSAAGAVTASAMAHWLGVRPALASAMIEQLSDRALVEGSALGGVRLTSHGQQVAHRVVRRRRLLESVLITMDGYPVAAAQIIAARVAYAIPDAVVENAATLFGEPDLTPSPKTLPAWAAAMRAHTSQARRMREDATDSGGVPSPESASSSGPSRRAAQGSPDAAASMAPATTRPRHRVE